MPTATKPKLTAEDLKFGSPSQREIMRVVLAKFAEYETRNQHYFRLEGMSTAHITVKCIEDFVTLRAAWPPELIDTSHQHMYGVIYQMQEDTMTKVQSNIRKDLDKLAKAGYLEKVGNEDERRWKPVKALRGVTL